MGRVKLLLGVYDHANKWLHVIILFTYMYYSRIILVHNTLFATSDSELH